MKRRNGFSLLEVIVALVIFEIVALAVILGLVYAAHVAQDVSYDMIAKNLAVHLVETMMTDDLESVVPETQRYASYATQATSPYLLDRKGIKSRGLGVVRAATATTLQVNNTGWPTQDKWKTNEWKGFLVEIISGVGEGQVGLVKLNSQDTLTITTDLVGGASQAWQTVPYASGRDTHFRLFGGDLSRCGVTIVITGYGNVSAASGTSLTDSSANWEVGEWTNGIVLLVAGRARGQKALIRSNTAQTLQITTDLSGTTIQAWSVIPNATTQYLIDGGKTVKIATNWGGRYNVGLRALVTRMEVKTEED